MQKQLHPLDPLRPEEISRASQILRQSQPNEHIVFRVITLQEPAKSVLLPYLEAEHLHQPLPQRPRREAMVQFFSGSSENFYQVIIDLDRASIVSGKDLRGYHSYTDFEEQTRLEQLCLFDDRILKVIEKLALPEGAVINVEPWTYAPDGVEDAMQRLTMCYFYMSLSSNADSNHFMYPLDFCAEVSDDGIKKIFKLPGTAEERVQELRVEDIRRFDRRKIHSGSEYHPALKQDHRTSTKPYQVWQPKGPSFRVQGQVVEWEKWRFRVGFNYREGLTLHDITYDSRRLFYRLSLSEMFVPYGDSRAPYPRKAAFDLGNNGAGCDCLGHIKYFDAYHNTLKGQPVVLPNVVCCHEIDDGILWKHTNYRTQNAVVTRSRVLVLQTIITVANYEYIFAFHFTQAASVRYEVRATGILSTAPIELNEQVPYGKVVAPGVMAPYHQHLFSLRIDPWLDGQKNSFAVSESVPMALDPHTNPFGVGYTTRCDIIESESAHDLDITKARTFRIINENSINPISGRPVGYDIVPSPAQMLLAHPSSFHSRRSEFADHAFWVTRHHDGELFAAGDHTMQSQGGQGIASWIKGERSAGPAGQLYHRPGPLSVRDDDIVVWHTFGTTHNPRVEDWPVMPEERMTVTLKPNDFFERNPSLDVQPSRQEDNKSVLVVEDSECCADALKFRLGEGKL
ncbi:uncharacterized protein PV07_00830 [Cladophialophora immunda]|uniref:Amine oxidase n=1 Tax=Cladophialophora immunda TaxID=569365 RepID=A0A0D2CS91_9EURO|nr:uncharacterized protein PV07_00830 [Cladophialophora immunda]KIW34028.1 hypothetical protein PV07_00830 [Cladophialophora immunda]